MFFDASILFSCSREGSGKAFSRGLEKETSIPTNSSLIPSLKNPHFKFLLFRSRP